MTSCISVHHLNKSFRTGFLLKPRQVLNSVSFELPERKTSGFIGGNGQGKTTTIKCLLQAISPDQGDVKFWGQPLSSALRARIGFLPERPYYYEYLTAEEYLSFHWRLAGQKRNQFEERKKEILDIVDLKPAAHQRLRTFSKGMLQRMGLAQALLCRPDLLILDEPMSGLDPDGRLLVKDILKDQKSKGVSIFFSSHLLTDMDELCDHLVVIDQGRICYDGVPEGFRKTHPDLENAFRHFRKQQKELNHV